MVHWRFVATLGSRLTGGLQTSPSEELDKMDSSVKIVQESQ